MLCVFSVYLFAKLSEHPSYRDTEQSNKRKNQNSKSKRQDTYMNIWRHKWQDTMNLY